MNIDITARHDTLNDDLRDHATDRFEHALRLADDVVSVHVILDSERMRHSAEVVVHGRNLSAAVHADGDDHFLAIDRCADKLRHQLEHHLGRRRDKRRRNPGLAAAEAEVAARLAVTAAEEEDAAAPARANGDGESEPDGPGLPPIQKMTAAALKRLSLEAARVELAASGAHFVVYKDTASQHVSVLYRMRDGQRGLIETGAA